MPKRTITITELEEALAESFHASLLERTSLGLDPEGVPWQRSAYSPRHAKRRTAASLPLSPVNLRFTGAMMKSVHVNGNEVSVGPGQDTKADANDELRSWMRFGLYDRIHQAEVEKQYMNFKMAELRERLSLRTRAQSGYRGWFTWRRNQNRARILEG